MKTGEFDYYLPEELIAQKPIAKRDESRLMYLDKETGVIKESLFKDIVDFLNPGDLLVMNNSKVFPARLYGRKLPTGTEIEVFLLNEKEEDLWEVLVRPGKRVKEGTRISFGNGELTGETVAYTDFGGRLIKFNYEGDFFKLVDKLGEMPLPPYIKSKLENSDRYQTVYAEKRGSVAAPTAGLHFTPKLLKKIRAKGVETSYITLHVGLGTFRPVKTEEVEEHVMHAEYYEITPEVIDKILKTRQAGKRVIAVGTTVTRTLEGAATGKDKIKPAKGWIDIFIYPGYDFKIIDGLITNFHLPKSTLLMLVSALAGKDNILHAYHMAVEKKFRFFSLGDAMFIT